MADKSLPENNKTAPEILPTRFRRRISLNIGTIIFGAVLIYLIISLVLFLTANHVISYQVTSGPLAQNQTYNALILRSETVIKSETGGYVSYYARENNKIRKTGAVFGIGQEPQSIEQSALREDALSGLRLQMENFSGSFDPSDFYETYNYRYRLEGDIMSAFMAASPGSIGGSVVSVGDQTVATAPSDGVVVYATDGYEDFDTEDMTASDLDRKAYKKTDLKTKDTVKPGTPIYKLVTSEEWSVVIPLSSRQIVQLDGRTNVRVKFLKDNTTQIGRLTILTGGDGAYYGRIDFVNGMIRYINDRFVEIELVTNTQTGLKIPISSIVSKSFYTVPEDYATVGGDSNRAGFLKLTRDDEGNEKTVFVDTTLYEHKNGLYYIDNTDFHRGDIVLKGSTAADRFEIGETASLEGVYSLNKGYAVFRKIVIIDKNEDYCIVEKGTSFGISQFDYIVLNSSEVAEEEITVKG